MGTTLTTPWEHLGKREGEGGRREEWREQFCFVCVGGVSDLRERHGEGLDPPSGAQYHYRKIKGMILETEVVQLGNELNLFH